MGVPLVGFAGISHKTFVYTPQKSKRDIKNNNIEEKEPPFPNHSFWYPLEQPPTQDASHHQDYEPFLGSGIPT